MATVRGALLALLAAVGVVGCGASGPTSTIAPITTVALAALPQLTSLGIHLEPPPAGSTTTITPARAVGVCQGFAECPRDRTRATVSLATGTTDTAPDLDHQLVVAVLFPHSECAADSPPMGYTPATPSDPDACLWVVLLNAETGAVLFNGAG